MQKAIVGGILTIVSSILGILTGLFIAAMPLFLNYLMDAGSGFAGQQEIDMLWVVGAVYVGIGAFFVLIGVLGIVGGVFSLKRKCGV